MSITNLMSGQRVSNAVFTVKGTATDNWMVSNVWYQLNSGGWTNATGTTGNWSAVLDLTPGTNILMACAVDITWHCFHDQQCELPVCGECALAGADDRSGNPVAQLQ